MIFSRKTARRFFNCKGFSLAELMVSMGISVLVSGFACLAFLMAFDVYLRMIRQYEAEVEMSSLMQTLRSTFATAVYTTYGGPSINVNNISNGASTDRGVSAGRLYSISDANVPLGGANYSGAPFLIGMFNRENVSGALQSDLAGVQIVYQRPDADANRSGALYIDYERNPDVNGGFVRLRPVNAPQMFTRLTNFEVDNVKVYNSDGSIINTTSAGGPAVPPCTPSPNCIGNPVVSAEVRMVMRYFTVGNDINWKWCNAERMAGFANCTMTGFTKYHDVERRMNVVFINNSYEFNEYQPRRPFGNLYFFAPWRPLRKGP